MNNQDIYEKIAIKIKKNSINKDVNKMANIIYFIIKQYPEQFGKKNDLYNKLLENVKIGLTESCGWDMIDVGLCFLKLNDLTKYIK